MTLSSPLPLRASYAAAWSSASPFLAVGSRVGVCEHCVTSGDTFCTRYASKKFRIRKRFSACTHAGRGTDARWRPRVRLRPQRSHLPADALAELPVERHEFG